MYVARMNIDTRRVEASKVEDLAEWRSLHPEFTDEEFDEALIELRAYLRLAWVVYRARNPDLNLPDSL